MQHYKLFFPELVPHAPSVVGSVDPSLRRPHPKRMSETKRTNLYTPAVRFIGKLVKLDIFAMSFNISSKHTRWILVKHIPLTLITMKCILNNAYRKGIYSSFHCLKFILVYEIRLRVSKNRLSFTSSYWRKHWNSIWFDRRMLEMGR